MRCLPRLLGFIAANGFRIYVALCAVAVVTAPLYLRIPAALIVVCLWPEKAASRTLDI